MPFYKRLLTACLVASFLGTSIGPIPAARAEGLLNLPEPGVMVGLSPAFQPAIIKGITVHKDNPFLFDFIVDVGQDRLAGPALKTEGERLIKYFMASLAIPEKDLWVNLSPYEKDRTVPEALSQTEMGRDLLAQDYLLKQITASLIYPETGLGKKFWDRVYAKSQEKYGSAQIPVNTFNKVWIVADKASIFERNQTAFVTSCHLKVMLEQDYLATATNRRQPGDMFQQEKQRTCPPAGCQASEGLKSKATQGANSLRNENPIGTQILRDIILPELEQEVNGGKNFAGLRQIFNSLVLAAWYKKNLRDAVLNQVYADQSKVKGIDLKDRTVKQQIYERYLKAYKKGVFNFIKEDVRNGQAIPRKYFSGGVVGDLPEIARDTDPLHVAAIVPHDRAMVQMSANLMRNADAAMVGQPDAVGSNSEELVGAYSDDRKAMSQKGRLVPVREIRAYWEPVEVKFSRQINALGLTRTVNGAQVPLDNDSYYYGKSEEGKSTRRGRPHWLYILKPTAEGVKSGIDPDDQLFAGDGDIRSTFPQSRFKTQYDKFELLRENKDIERKEYEARVTDLKSIAILLAGKLDDEGVFYLKELLADIDKKGVGDATYASIDMLYEVFSSSWKTIFAGQTDVTMEDFLSAWGSFQVGLPVLQAKDRQQKGLAGVLSLDEIRKILMYLNTVNDAIKPALAAGTTEDFIRHWDELGRTQLGLAHNTRGFLEIVENMHLLFAVALEVQTRLVRDRLARGQGKHSRIHEDDEIKSPYIHSLRLIAQHLLQRKFAGLKDGDVPMVLVADAQGDAEGGRLRKDLGDNADQFAILDMESRLRRDVHTDKVAAVQAEIHKLGTDGRPIVAGGTAFAKELYLAPDGKALDPDYRAKAIVLAHVLNKLKPAEIRDALRAVMRLLDEPVDDPDTAPILYISLPENIALRRTQLEQTLFKLGFTPVEQAEGMRFIFNEDTQAKLQQQFVNEMIKEGRLRSSEALTHDMRDEINRQISDVERFVKKQFQFGAYARTHQPDGDINVDDGIPEISLKRTAKKSQPTGMENRFLSDLDWNSLQAFAAISPLGATAVIPGDSTKIIRKGSLDPRIGELETSLSAVEWFLEYAKAAQIAGGVSRFEQAKLDAAEETLRVWDDKDNPHPYVSEKEFYAIVEGFRQGGISPINLKKIISLAAGSGASRAYGALNLDSYVIDPFYKVLETKPPRANLYPIETLYKIFHGISGDEAMLSPAEIKDTPWAQAIVGIMERGEVPTADLMFAHVTPRARASLMLIWNKITGGKGVDELIADTTKAFMEDRILEAVDGLEAAGQAPTIEHVAASLFRDVPYFRAWHHQVMASGKSQTEAESLKQWIDVFHNGDTEGLLLVPAIAPSPTAISEADLKEKLAGAVTALQSMDEHRGHMLLIDDVAAYLDKQDEFFKRALGILRETNPGLTPVDGLLHIIRETHAGITDAQISHDFHIFVPDAELRAWEENKDATPDRVNRQALASDRDFEIELMALMWFFSGPKELRVRMTAGLLPNAEWEIARIRYLWDNKQVSYLTKRQIDVVRSSAGVTIALTGRNMSAVQDSLRHVFLNYLIELDRDTDIDLFSLRPLVSARLGAVKAIIAYRDQFRKMPALSAVKNIPIEQRAGTRILRQDVRLTFTNVAAALAYFGDMVTPQQLKDWFAGEFMTTYGITPADLGIRDDITAPAPAPTPQAPPAGVTWATWKVKLDTAVSHILEHGTESQGVGVMPNINNVAAYMMNTDQEFHARVSEPSRAGELLWAEIKKANPELTEYDALKMGIFVPRGELQSWNDRFGQLMGDSKTRATIVPRAKIGQEPILKEFEVTLTGVILLFDKSSDDELILMLRSRQENRGLNEAQMREKVRNLRMAVAEIRYLWDTLQALYLTLEQMNILLSFASYKTSTPLIQYPQPVKDWIALTAWVPMSLAGNQSVPYAVGNLAYYYFVRLAAQAAPGFTGPREKILRTQTGLRLANISTLREPVTAVTPAPIRQAIAAAGYRLTFENVAEYLTQFNDAIGAQGLRDWFNSQEIRDYTTPGFYGIEDESSEVNPLKVLSWNDHLKPAIAAAVAKIRTNGQGLMPDADNVADAFSEAMPLYRQYAEAKLKADPDKPHGDVFVEWIKTLQRGITDDQIYLQLGIFVPTPELRHWEERREAAGSTVSRIILGSRSREYMEFEMRLTALIWLDNKILNGEFSMPSEDEARIRRIVAEMRYLEKASYYTQQQVRSVLQLANWKVSTNAVLQRSIWMNFLDALFQPDGDSKVDIFNLRPRETGGRMAILSAAAAFRRAGLEALKKAQGAQQALQIQQIRKLNAYYKSRIGHELITNSPLTMAQLAALLSRYFGDPVTESDLRDWFKSDYAKAYSVKPEFFGIVDRVPQAVEPVAPQPVPTAAGETVAPPGKTTRDSIAKAVQAIVESKTGFVPDVYAVADRLYGEDDTFRAFVDEHQPAAMAEVDPDQFGWFARQNPTLDTREKRQQRAARGRLLVSWIKQQHPDMTTEEKIFAQWGMFVPTQQDLDWEIQRDGKEHQGSGIMTLTEIRAQQKNFDLMLTALQKFYGQVTDDQFVGLRSKGKSVRYRSQVLRDRLLLAQIEFQLDTLGATYLERGQYESFLKMPVSTKLDLKSLPDLITSAPNFRAEARASGDFIRAVGGEEADVLRVEGETRGAPISIIELLAEATRTQGGRMPTDPFIVRAPDVRRLAAVQYLVALRNAFYDGLRTILKESREEDKPDKARKWMESRMSNSAYYYANVTPILQQVTTEGMAVALTNLGYPTTVEELKRSNINLAAYGIWDAAELEGWENIQWPRMEEKLREAVEHLETEDRMADIDSVAEYLYANFPAYTQWVDHNKITWQYFSPRLGVRNWLTEFRKNQGIDPLYELLRDFGIYSPVAGMEGDEWEKNRHAVPPGERIDRREFASGGVRLLKTSDGTEVPVDLREFEARLTAAGWFTGKLTYPEMKRLFLFLSDEQLLKIKALIGALRYLWDKKDASYLRAKDVADLYQFSEMSFKANDVPQTFKGWGKSTRGGLASMTLPGRDMRNIMMMFSSSILSPAQAVAKDQLPESLRVRPGQDRKRLTYLSMMVRMRNQVKFAKRVLPETGKATQLAFRLAGARTRLFPVISLYPAETVFQSPNSPLTLEDIQKVFQQFHDNISMEELAVWMDSDFVKKKHGITLDSLQTMDAAMTTRPEREGGINLDTSAMSMSITKEGAGVAMTMDAATLERIKREGVDSLTPVIFSIKPVTSIWPLLGMAGPPQV